MCIDCFTLIRVPLDVLMLMVSSREGRVAATMKKLAEEQYDLAMTQKEYTAVRAVGRQAIEVGTHELVLPPGYRAILCADEAVPQRGRFLSYRPSVSVRVAQLPLATVVVKSGHSRISPFYFTLYQ